MSSPKGKERDQEPVQEPDLEGGAGAEPKPDLSADRRADRERNHTAMSSTRRLKKAIKAEEAKLPGALAEAQLAWEKRGGTWDSSVDEPEPLDEHTAWSWTTGKDWSTEEKAKLSAAKQKLVGATLAFASCGTGWFILTSNAIAGDTAKTKIEAHTNTTTSTDVHVDNNSAGAAAVGMAQGAYLALGGGITALGVVGYAVREYYKICANHAKVAGDPYEEVMAKVLEIDAKIRKLEERLAAEQAKVAGGRSESNNGGQGENDAH